MKVSFSSALEVRIEGCKFMSTPKYWPLDLDPEEAVYENPAWDLPGFRMPHWTRVTSSTPCIASPHPPKRQYGR